MLKTFGRIDPPLPGREAVCQDCHLVYWIFSPHECLARR